MKILLWFVSRFPIAMRGAIAPLVAIQNQEV